MINIEHGTVTAVAVVKEFYPCFEFKLVILTTTH